MHAPERDRLPTVVATEALRAAFGADRNAAPDLIEAVRVQYNATYENLQSPWQAEVVGSLLALSCLGISGSGIHSERMLLLKWNASFSESHPGSSVPLWVEAAYAFALCVQAARQRSSSQLAGAMLTELRVTFPLEGAGVFDLNDIKNIGS